MSMDHLRPTERRVLEALCAIEAPLGLEPLPLSRRLQVSRNAVSVSARLLEEKGLCQLERVGARTYLRPTLAGRALNNSTRALAGGSVETLVAES
jgi:DNA-binding MarR family transcriptional regulator